ncbi:MAG: hypothetical protein KY432_10315, partial [Acidobacteria bacterium]|nr:hypothetical protein [Acidobacteriota bacterium]
YDLVREQADVGEIRGRHPVLAGVIGERQVVVKRLFHGGSTASLWKDRFLSTRRAFCVREAVEHLARHDIPTPELFFLTWIRQNGLVRAEIGFERIFGKDADHLFFENENPPENWEEKADQIGSLAAELHQSEFEHGDLNMMNIFFAENGGCYILDLDKVELHRGGLDPSTRSRNLARLERSIRKQGRIHGRPHQFVDAVVERVQQAYDRLADDSR